jgi:PAS domain S-box-containing protein
VSIAKGFGFVLITSLLLFAALRRLLRIEFEARAKAEETMRRLTELQTLAEQSGELLYKHDIHHRFTYVSPQCYSMLGYGPKDLGMQWTQLATDNPINLKALEHTERAIQTGERQPPYQVEMRKKDGSAILLEVDETPLKDASGKVIAIIGAARDVTQREHAAKALRQSEEALRESELKMRALYTSMNEGMALYELICDAAGRPVDYHILEVNPAYERIVGFTREQVIGKLASEAYSGRQPLHLEIYAPVAISGQPTFFETFVAPLHKHFAISVFSPRRGQFATVFADITKRKEAESQLSLLSQVYALISNINQAIVRISDRKTLFQEACRIAVVHAQFRLAWIGWLDQTTGEIHPAAWAGHDEGYVAKIQSSIAPTGGGLSPTGSAVREGRVVICSDIATDPRMAPWREAALARGYRSSLALPLKVGDRVVGAFGLYSSEVNYFSTIVVESLIEVAADLSFALNLFERNRQRESEQQQLRLQHSALEAAANAIVITNREGTIEWVNAAFTRFTGYTRDEVIGLNPRVLKSGLQDHAFYQRLWQTVLAGEVWQGTLTNKRKDGSLYEEEMTITPVRSDSGEITHFVAIKQDITERKKLEQQFLRAQRMQSIGLLAGGVAHDLNNVLAPVLMALPLLRNDMAPDQREHILQMLEQSVQRGANIVRQVLTYARGIEVQRTQVQLLHLIREVAKIAEETFPRDIQIRSNAPASLWPLQGDPTQIHQVLLNLAVNARDAMPEGGELSFTGSNVELREPLQFLDFEIPPGRYVSVAVADTGTGISHEIIERMFQPFFTTKPIGKGTGLGLSTVLGIVKSHGGLVEVETRQGAGSKFTVFLPAAPAEVAPAVSNRPPSLPQGRGETILLVDDEAGIVQVAKSMLVANGYRVIAAKDGVEALDRLAEQGAAIKVVVTDIMMPAMDGLAMTRALHRINPTLPVIASTGLLNPPGEEDRAGQLRELGVKHFLRKPFQAEELLAALREVLDR